MADEQYAWLDKEAAEKLLRGEPVDPAEGRPRQDAERLAAALDAVARTARPATGELPGEAAALAAFRAAPRSPRTAGITAAHDDEAETATLAPVHIGRAAGPKRTDRPFRWSRPLRFGLVASLACCAIGGVAVAAGSGMLPGPFGRHTPSPATSVSAAESPEELGTDVLPDEETSAPPPPGTPTPDAPPPGDRPDADDEDTALPGDGASHDDRSGKDDGTGTDRTGGSRTGGATSPGGGTSHDDGDGDSDEDTGKGSGHSGDDPSGSWYAKTLQACRDYRDGTLDADRRTRLEALAKGARNLDRFCDRLLDAEDGKHGSGAGDAEQGGDASAPLPAIRFTESPGPSTAAVAPDPGATDFASDDPWPAASAAAR
ncbi:hypothetical protein OHS17_20970 [Streptomyces sp. NBC_00523]|uniref:hypothetical protein n=1 Tax=Streptomyces sp. NBC_00523 TaxID=2975765 RepID=UPI002E8240BC|nr:hypothetical protein [Streptomyces sp. NBC_00523]WUD01957.1 hypothetical protein OHS17_20970 [Streptomyces sp. NBC_00523]